MKFVTEDGMIFTELAKAEEHEAAIKDKFAAKDAAYKKLIDAHKALEDARAEYKKLEEECSHTDNTDIPDIWKMILGL